MSSSISVSRGLVFTIVGSSRWKSLYLRLLGKDLLLVDLKDLLVSNRNVDHLEKCGLISDFWYGFRCSQSSEDLLKVVSGI